ncbi:transposase [Streptomyces sp. NPDC005533]|uniref:transposase n=1 Tax=Streptomyces sp. NPDC005533 TaxID=3364723 RepID=UPI0036C183DA
MLRLPSFKFALNQAWCTLLALAMDLLSWLQLLALDGRLARAEPATVRSDLFDVPARLAEHARRRELKLDPPVPPSGFSLPPGTGPGPARPRLTTTPPPQPPEGGERQPPWRVDADDRRDDTRPTALPHSNQPTERTTRNRAPSRTAHPGART